MTPDTVKLIGTFRPPNPAYLYDTATAERFTRDVLHVLQGPPLATILQDVATALEPYGRVPSPGERGVFAVAYASLATVILRTYSARGFARFDIHSQANAIELPQLLALVSRHYSTADVCTQDLTRFLRRLPE